jgi:tetratricopeptide (TPR) repeat protein
VERIGGLRFDGRLLGGVRRQRSAPKRRDAASRWSGPTAFGTLASVKWGIVLGCVLLVAPVAATAQRTTEVTDLEEDARLRFQLGQRHFERGELDDAAREFEEAYRLSGRPALLYNLYIVHRDAARPTEAAAALRRYLELQPDVPNRSRLEVVLRNLERGTVERSSERTSSGGSATQAASSAEPAVGALVLLSTGTAALAVSLITGLVALDGSHRLNAQCPNDVCPESARGLADEVQALSITTDIFWPVGTAAALGGLVWLLVSLSSRTEASTGLTWGAGASPSGAWASVGGSF